MTYQCTEARFRFFNGNKSYTVEYCFGLSTWYVFEENKNTDALYKKEINPEKAKAQTGIMQRTF
jgi:hypothetical protein